MTSYPLAQHSWDDDEVITISSKNDQLIGTFPVEFLRHSGLNHWEYIYDVIIQLVDGVQGGVFYTTDGAPICNSDPLRAGDYHYVPQGELCIDRMPVRHDTADAKMDNLASFSPKVQSTLGKTFHQTRTAANQRDQTRRDLRLNRYGFSATQV